MWFQRASKRSTGDVLVTDFGRRRKSEYVEGNPSGLHPVIFPSQEVVFK